MTGDRLRVHVNHLPRGLSSRSVRRAVAAAFRHEGVAAGEVSVTFLGDEEIRELNRTYLERDRTTDVLAFALHDAGEDVLGDLYVGLEQARRQARDLGVALREELLRLVVHGALHLLGRDHPEDEGREESSFFSVQERLLADLRRDP